jgi:hypothetical protein
LRSGMPLPLAQVLIVWVPGRHLLGKCASVLRVLLSSCVLVVSEHGSLGRLTRSICDNPLW